MKRNEILIALAILLVGLILPGFITSPVWITVLNIFFYYAVVSMSWNIVFGFAGLFSFGHMAFAAIGGYISALLAIHLELSPFLGMLFGGLLCALLGFLLGGVVLRVRGFYLCLVTWAFAEITNVVIKTEHRVTGGTGGLLTPSLFTGPGADRYSYFFGLGLLLLVFIFSALLFHSRKGLFLFAIRDDLDAAENMGVNTRLWKAVTFSIGGFWAGIAGAYYAHFFNLIDPTIGGLDEMGKICLMVIVGGIGTLYGPLLGAFFVVISSEIIRGSLAEMSLLIFSIVMILTMRFASGGFMEIFRRLFPNLRNSSLASEKK